MNDFQIKDIASGVLSNMANSAMMSMGVDNGAEIANKVFSGIQSNGKEIVENALKSGSSYGVKAAMGAAMKICSDKGLIKSLPANTSSDVFGSISHVAVENAQTLSKIATGEISNVEGEAIIQETTIATTTSIIRRLGGKIGQKIGMIFGPAGAAIGRCVGTAVGYMAGTKVGKTIYEGAKKVATKVVTTVKSVASKVVDKVKSFGSKIFSGIKSLFGF